MKHTRLDSKFFESTRGQIVQSLRGGNRTVNELAAELGLTDNAIRANLLTLERDKLVHQAESVKGFRKPHFSYALTDEARDLFPKAYDSLFNRLVDVLKSGLARASVLGIMRETGRSIGSANAASPEASVEERVDHALAALEELGGSAVTESDEGNIYIKSGGCPFAEAVAEHPEVCQVAEAMLSEITGLPVEEHCDRRHKPKCSFAIKTAHP